MSSSSSSVVVGTADELTGQAVYAFVAMKPEFDFQAHSEPELLKELTLQVRKVIGPFAAPKGIFLGASGSCVLGFAPCCKASGPQLTPLLPSPPPVSDLPKTRSGKIVRRALSESLSSNIVQVAFSDCFCVSAPFREGCRRRDRLSGRPVDAGGPCGPRRECVLVLLCPRLCVRRLLIVVVSLQSSPRSNPRCGPTRTHPRPDRPLLFRSSSPALHRQDLLL